MAIIINACSTNGDEEMLTAKQALKDTLASIFTRAGLTVNISLAASGAKISSLARQAVDSGAAIVVAGGGDGTVSTVAAEVVGTDKVLGVLPLGTLNHFAKDLNIPLALEEAAATIMTGEVAKVDAAEVNGQVFINNSSLGLYPTIVHEREKHQRLGAGKWPAFVWAGIAVLRRYPFLDIRLSVHGSEMVLRTPFVFIGNNEYEMESLNVGARSSLGEGKLSLYVIHPTGRLGLLRLALRALFGGLNRDRDFDALSAEEIWIETKHRKLRVATDGEVSTLTPPLHYRIKPLSLNVMVPRRTEQ
jgi:diacylglycerol kinase family enzyme